MLFRAAWEEPRMTNQLAAPITVMIANAHSDHPIAHATTARTRRTPESSATIAAYWFHSPAPLKIPDSAAWNT